MNPNNGQTSLEYLNQIAPQTPKASSFKLKMRRIIFIGIIVIILVCIAAITISAVNANKKKPWQQLNARLTTTQTIATDATKNLKNSQIRSLNSDLKLYLTNTQRDMTKPFTQLEIVGTKLPKSILEAESGAEITERLENARLNAKFDSTYAREMSYQLAGILSLYQELYSLSSQTTKQTLETAYNNLLPTQQGFASFSAANE